MANDIPNELIYEIFHYLPVKSLLRFKSVSKSLFATISNEKFINSHLKTSSSENRLIVLDKTDNPSLYNIRVFDINGSTKFRDENFRLELKPTRTLYGLYQVFSCNGLILLIVGWTQSKSRHQLAVWNPFTRAYKNLPTCPVGVINDITLSFGYDSSKDNYKVLAIKKNRQVWIFGFKSGIWTRIQDFPYVEYKVYSERGRNYFADGALHVLCCRRQCGTFKVVAFDVAEETFSMISKPEGTTGSGFPELQVIQGSLCWCERSSTLFKIVEIYARKKHGADFTWNKLWSVKDTQCFGSLTYAKGLRYSKEGDKMLISDGDHVYSYDCVKEYRQKIENMGIVHGAKIVSCIESLVPVNFSRRIRKRKRINCGEM